MYVQGPMPALSRWIVSNSSCWNLDGHVGVRNEFPWARRRHHFGSWAFLESANPTSEQTLFGGRPAPVLVRVITTLIGTGICYSWPDTYLCSELNVLILERPSLTLVIFKWWPSYFWHAKNNLPMARQFQSCWTEVFFILCTFGVEFSAFWQGNTFSGQDEVQMSNLIASVMGLSVFRSHAPTTQPSHQLKNYGLLITQHSKS